MSSRRSRYLAYLPAVYSGQDSAFVGEYLNIFEKLLTGIDDEQLNGRKGIQQLLASDVIGNLFYPRLSFLFDPADTEFIPPISGAKPAQETAILADLDSYIGVPTPDDPLAGFLATQPQDADAQAACEAWLNDFLIWLGQWVALVVDNSWSIDKKRTVIAQIMALYRMRGTVQGIGFLINLLLDLPLTVSGMEYSKDGAQPVTGQVVVSISNPVPPDIMVSDQASKAFILQDQYRPGAPVVSGYCPWLFQVQMTLPNAKNNSFILTGDSVQQILALYRQLQQLLAMIKPAASKFVISIIPSMQLQTPAYATQLGVNTLLGEQGQTQT